MKSHLDKYFNENSSDLEKAFEIYHDCYISQHFLFYANKSAENANYLAEGLESLDYRIDELFLFFLSSVSRFSPLSAAKMLRYFLNYVVQTVGITATAVFECDQRTMDFSVETMELQCPFSATQSK